jgi:hypothetical protein
MNERTRLQREASVESTRRRRANQTPEEKERERESSRQRTQEIRANQTPEQRQAELVTNRQRIQEIRANQTPEEKEAELQRNRLRIANQRVIGNGFFVNSRPDGMPNDNYLSLFERNVFAAVTLYTFTLYYALGKSHQCNNSEYVPLLFSLRDNRTNVFVNMF